jgi:DNA primase
VIPPGFLQDLLARTDIAEVVGRHVELKRGGANLMGLCPFHGEKSPSFSVSPVKQFYYCFGCGASGDAIRFLTEHLGLSFVEAVRDLAGRVGMQVPEEQVSAEEQQRRQKLRERRDSLSDVLAKAAAYYRSQLRETPRAIDYLKQRGLSGAIAARFGLGFAPAGWRTLAGVFARYDDPLLEEAGLVRLRDEAEGEGSNAKPAHSSRDSDRNNDSERARYDWFRDRVMFPIRSVTGEVIGFGGRVLDDSKPKYMNSPETPVFSKGRELYGLFEARQALRDKGYVLVVEGYMDVVALAQSGFANAVATLGTACTAEHVQKLFRHTDSVVFSFDGDAAGRRAAGRALEAALPHASDLRSVRFLFLPPEHDPDSFVRSQGAAAFDSAVAQAVPLSRQLVEQAGEGCELANAEGRARMLAQARPLWEALPEGALKRQLLPELARQAQLSTDDLAALWGGAAVGAVPSTVGLPGLRRPAGRAPLRRSGRRAPAASADLALRLLLRHSDWWERLGAEDQQLLHELDGPHGETVAWLERQLTDQGPQTWAALDSALQDDPLHEQARRWVDAALPDETPDFAELGRVLNTMWIARLGDEANVLALQAGQDAGARQRLQALLQRIAALKAHAAARPASPG